MYGKGSSHCNRKLWVICVAFNGLRVIGREIKLISKESEITERKWLKYIERIK